MPRLDTITAVASGWSSAPRAIVRLSGPGVRGLLGRLFDPPPSPKDDGAAAIRKTAFRLAPAPASESSQEPTHRLDPKTRADANMLRLPCLVMCFAAPRSYTGEDCAEILLPGNPFLLERILAQLSAEPSVREAHPGEFSARAYLNGRLTLAQAEGVAHTIAAQTDEALAAAHRLTSGETGRTYQTWADELTTLLALVEAGIDFADQEDVVAISAAELGTRVDRLAGEIRSWLGPGRAREQTNELPRVVLTGAPNAGKSTLFNALLRKKRSVESAVAGTTRDAIVEELDLSDVLPGTGKVLLIDAAGVADRPAGAIDAAAQKIAREAISRSDAAIHCDPTGRFEEAMSFPARGEERGTPDRSLRNTTVIRVRTKSDLPGMTTTQSAAEFHSVCALDGWNLDTLRRAIADVAWARTGGGQAGLLPRHARALGEALSCLERAAATARQSIDLKATADGSNELTATDLRSALDRLGDLLGRISPDEVIGRVFATFCVGK